MKTDGGKEITNKGLEGNSKRMAMVHALYTSEEMGWEMV